MADPQFVWRAGRESDAEPIAVLERALFGDTAWAEPVLREELTGPYRRYTVIERAGEIVGYGGVLVVGGDGDVQTIALTESARGKGLGRALLNRLVSDAAEMGARQIFLEVRSDNPSAIHLYESTGFERIGTRQGYYQPGNIDAIIMCLPMQHRIHKGRE